MGIRWDRAIGWNPNINPVGAMRMGIHP